MQECGKMCVYIELCLFNLMCVCVHILAAAQGFFQVQAPALACSRSHAVFFLSVCLIAYQQMCNRYPAFAACSCVTSGNNGHIWQPQIETHTFEFVAMQKYAETLFQVLYLQRVYMFLFLSSHFLIANLILSTSCLKQLFSITSCTIISPSKLCPQYYHIS